MATNFPGAIQSIPNPTSTDLLENATPELDHDYQHATINDTVEALEAKVGIDGSAVTTSHDYKLGEVTGSDKAVGKTATQTLTNKTLTSPQINFGSDARGDIMVRNGSGVSTRLPIGTSGQILQASASGDPEWVANPSASDASTTVKGVVEIATTAEINAGTGTGGTGAKLVMTPDAFITSDFVVNQVDPTDIQTFTANGTWTKPTGAKVVEVICIGAGGGGGSSSGAAVDAGASGGGGGAKTIKKFNASDLASTVSVTRGTGGTGGTNGNPGTAGETSSFGTLLTAAGGGGGTNVASNTSSSGGGGGGLGEGQGGQSGAGSLGGFPNNVTVGLVGAGTGGAGGVNNAVGKAAEYGGGSGGGGGAVGGVNGYAGGDSFYGAGGGGGGGSKGTTTGGAGGGVGTVLTGNGGAGGASGVAGTAGSAATDAFGCGTGGGGGGGNSGGAGGAGGAGGLPGGGGGGGGTGSSSNSGTGGAGANGKVVVITYF